MGNGKKGKIRALVAEDDASTRASLVHMLTKWGFEVIEATDGRSAWRAFGEDQIPQLVILDWEMPGLVGVEICRRIRSSFPDQGIHIIMLTSKTGTGECVEALNSGADDFVVKPLNVNEFQARVMVGKRITRGRETMMGRIRDLETALEALRGPLDQIVVCSYCRKTRNEKDKWESLENFLSRKLKVSFSHTVCPKCLPETVESELPEGDEPKGS